MKKILDVFKSLPLIGKIIAITCFPFFLPLALPFFAFVVLASASKAKMANNHSGNLDTDDMPDDYLQKEMNRQFDEWSMEESRKSATSMDQGGYL